MRLHAIVLLTGMALAACATSSIPQQYLENAERDVTLTQLKRSPEAYKGRTVILGGVVHEMLRDGQRMWFLVKNRPLDGDYVPHIPVDPRSEEGGMYWLVVNRDTLPKTYDKWSRITVVGRVSEEPPPAGTASSKVVLNGVYLRGWGETWGGYGLADQRWEDVQSAGAIMSTPRPVMKTGQ